MNYPKELDSNKKFRLEVILKAKDNPRVQALLLQKCKQDILFLVNVFGWTYNPRVEPSILPFITYEFQDETLLKLVDAVENKKEVFIEKSRDMGASWMIVVLQVWGLLNGYPSLYGSYKEDYVDSNGDMDSHFERMRFFMERLPSWLKPKDLAQTYMNIGSKELGANISGDAGQNFGTGGRRKFVVHDEFALWQNDKKAFRKTKDITNCRIFLGTPEGKWNVYGQIMTNAPEYQHLDIIRIRLHWSLHPLKDQEWYERQKATRTKLDIAKELDISYEDSVTGAVYPEFTERVRIQKCEYDPKLPIYCGWDFGRDMNAIIWAQKDFGENELHIIDAYQVKDKPIEYMAAFILGKPVIDKVTGLPFLYDDEELALMKKHLPWQSSYAAHYGDPYNGNATQTNTRNSIKQILAQYEIFISLKTGTKLEERIRRVKLLFPRMIVDESLAQFMQAMIQSRYPDETRQMTREKTKPIHDAFSHFRTAMEYLADNEPAQLNNQTTPLTYKLNTDITKVQREKTIDEELDDAFASPSSAQLLDPWRKLTR